MATDMKQIDWIEAAAIAITNEWCPDPDDWRLEQEMRNDVVDAIKRALRGVWIKTKTPPKEAGQYLVWWPGLDEGEIGYYDGESGWWDDWWGIDASRPLDHKPTHWQEIQWPSPPSIGQEDS